MHPEAFAHVGLQGPLLESLEGRVMLSGAWADAPFTGLPVAVVYPNHNGDAAVSGLSINPAGECDRYKLWFDQGGPAVFRTTGTTDTQMAYYNGPGAPDATLDNYGADVNPRLSPNVPAWEYLYLGVQGSLPSTSGSYSLLIDGPAATVEELAIAIHSRTSRSWGTIDSARDCDFYKFTTQLAGTWTVTAVPQSAPALDLTLCLYDASGNPVTGNWLAPTRQVAGAGQSEAWTAALAAGATYYVRVDAAAGTGNYQLTVEGPDPGSSPDRYPGIPDDLLTAYGYWIPDYLGRRITDVRTLVDEYAPVINMAAGEVFHPKPADMFIVPVPGDSYEDLPNLYDRGIIFDDVQSSLWSLQQLGSFNQESQAEYYIELPGLFYNDVVDSYNSLKDRFPDTIYTSVLADGTTRLAVQYFFLYYGNGWGAEGGLVPWNNHEGDWEGITLFFNQQGLYQATYFQHSDSESRYISDVTLMGTSPDATVLTHPAVYSAMGSHASYFQPGTHFEGFEHHYGDGDTLIPGRNLTVQMVPRDWSDLSNVDGADLRWVPYKGCWGTWNLEGMVEISGDDGPRGIFCGGKWSNPWQYAMDPQCQPDLTSTLFIANPQYPVLSSRQTSVYSCQINNGSGTAREFAVDYRLSDDSWVDGNDTLVGRRTVHGLAPHSTEAVEIVLDLGEAFHTDNQYYLGTIIDSTGTIAETIEWNNANYGGTGVATAIVSEDRHLSHNVDATATPQALALGDTVYGAVGDEWSGGCDVDIFSFSATAGKTYGFDVDILSGSLVPYLRLFNSSWVLLADNYNNAGGITDSYLQYAFATGGSYYLIVSSLNYLGINPVVLDNQPGPTGSYGLWMSDLNSDLVGASLTVAPDPVLAGGVMTVSYTVENVGLAAAGGFDVGFYLTDESAFTPAPDKLVRTVHIASLAGKGRSTGSFALDLADLDPFRSDNDYWLSMYVDSGGAVTESLEGNNLRRGKPYDQDDVRSEAHFAASGLTAEGLSVDVPLSRSIGDEWVGAYDVDVFSIAAATGQTMAFDLDRTCTTLNAYMRLYDSSLNLLASSDNAAAPGETLGLDPYVRYNFRADGTYYVVIGSVELGTYATTQYLRSLSARVAGSTTGSYDLLVSYFEPDMVGTQLVLVNDAPSDSGHVTATVTVKNQGAGAVGDFPVRFVLGQTYYWSSSYPVLLNMTVRAASLPNGCLIAGESTTFTVALDLPVPDPWRATNGLYVSMWINPDGDVLESDYQNNGRTGLEKDYDRVVSDRHLPCPVSSGVVAEPITPGAGGVTVHGRIGDEWIGPYDMDTYQFAASAGQMLSIDIQRTSGDLDSYIRLYSASWTLLAENDDSTLPAEGGTTDSYLLHTFASAGNYFLVVSADANAGADPRAIAGRAVATTGGYDLNVGPPLPDVLGTLFAVSPASPVGNAGVVTITYSLTNQGFVPTGNVIVGFYLSDDSTIDAADYSIGSVGPLVLSAGQTYSGTFCPATPKTDPFRTDNQYWLGMWATANGGWAETDSGNNVNRGAGLDKAAVSSEANLPSPAGGGAFLAGPLAIGNAVTGQIAGDEWIGKYDIDVFAFDAAEGQELCFDLDRLSGTLDSYLRLYDSDWKPLAANDNAAAPGEALGIDSYLEFTIPRTGQYLLAVSSTANASADPLALSGRSVGTMGTYELTVSPNQADLLGVSLSVLPNHPAMLNQPVVANFTLRNRGFQDAHALSILLVLSDDRAIGHDDITIGEMTIDGVGLDSTYTDSMTLSLPDIRDFRRTNQYWVGMIIDPDNRIPEFNESNNSGLGSGIDMADVSEEANLPCPIEDKTVVPTDIALGSTVLAGIGDEWVGACDVDIYHFAAVEGQELGIEITRLNGGLEPYLRVYSSWWDLLYSPEWFSLGQSVASRTYADMTLRETGSYYLVVSDAVNGSAPPMMLETWQPGQTGQYQLRLFGINQAPSFTKGPDQSVMAEDGPRSIASWATGICAGPPAESAQVLTFLTTNDNNALFSSQPAVGPDGTLMYTPAANAHGMATVTVVLRDSGGTANGGQDTSAARTFTIGIGNRKLRFFDETLYQVWNPDVAQAVRAGAFGCGFDHFVAYGQYEGRVFSIVYDETYYLAHNPDVAAAVQAHAFVTGYAHFIRYGWSEGRPGGPLSGDYARLHSFYDESFYLLCNPDVARAVGQGKSFRSGFAHFVAYGQYEKRTFSLYYDEAYYLRWNRDVALAVGAHAFGSAFEHFVAYGQHEGRAWSPLFNESYYLTHNLDVAGATGAGLAFRCGAEHFLAYGQYEARRGSQWYDEGYYLSHNPDVAGAVGPGKAFQSGLEHFLAYGRCEGRSGSSLYSELDYLALNPDVAATVGPGKAFRSGLEHFLAYGQREGRPCHL